MGAELGQHEVGRLGEHVGVVLGAVLLEVAETDGRHPLPAESERIAARRAGFETVDAAAWPRTAAASATMAAWISGEQFTWSLDRLLDGLVPHS